jgi:hypothetical protein
MEIFSKIKGLYYELNLWLLEQIGIKFLIGIILSLLLLNLIQFILFLFIKRKYSGSLYNNSPLESYTITLTELSKGWKQPPKKNTNKVQPDERREIVNQNHSVEITDSSPDIIIKDPVENSASDNSIKEEKNHPKPNINGLIIEGLIKDLRQQINQENNKPFTVGSLVYCKPSIIKKSIEKQLELMGIPESPEYLSILFQYLKDEKIIESKFLKEDRNSELFIIKNDQEEIVCKSHFTPLNGALFNLDVEIEERKKEKLQSFKTIEISI